MWVRSISLGFISVNFATSPIQGLLGSRPLRDRSYSFFYRNNLIRICDTPHAVLTLIGQVNDIESFYALAYPLFCVGAELSFTVAAGVNYQYNRE